MIPTIRAAVEMESLILPVAAAVASGAMGIITFFVTKHFNKSEKVEESQVTQVTHVALIHERIGQLSSSDAKQWTTLDVLSREVAELKLKVAVLESRGTHDRR